MLSIHVFYLDAVWGEEIADPVMQWPLRYILRLSLLTKQCDEVKNVLKRSAISSGDLRRGRILQVNARRTTHVSHQLRFASVREV